MITSAHAVILALLSNVSAAAMRPRLRRGDGGVILRLAIRQGEVLHGRACRAQSREGGAVVMPYKSTRCARPGADGIRTFTTGLARQQQALAGTKGSVHPGRPGTGMSCA